MSSSEFKSKVILITGACGDIGRAAVDVFYKRGAQIVAIDRKTDRPSEFAEQYSDERILYVSADVSDEFDVREYFSRAREWAGGVDVLFNNAGIEGPNRKLTELSAEEYRHVMAVNVDGVFMNMKYAIPSMVQRGGGSIINMSSGAGIRGVMGMAAYVASKHAVIGLTRTAALEWGREGVRSNCINPGPVKGRMMQSIIADYRSRDIEFDPDLFAKGTPTGRFTLPEEVAALAAFLGSDAAKNINGSLHLIDGGGHAG